MRKLSKWMLSILSALALLEYAECCTVLQFTNHSFSANAVRLMHALPIFEGTNGTLFLDFTASTHKCHADGGWQDFFDLHKHAGELLGMPCQWCGHCFSSTQLCFNYSLIENVVLCAQCLGLLKKKLQRGMSARSITWDI